MMEYYVERGTKEVHVAEMQSEIGKDLDLITKVSMMEIARDYDVNLHTETKLVEVCEDYFLVEKVSGQEKIDFDLGFVCLACELRHHLWKAW